MRILQAAMTALIVILLIAFVVFILGIIERFGCDVCV